MKVVNIMNFVREIDERLENSTEQLLAFTAEQLDLVNRYRLDNTFLLQYDVLCDQRFLTLFQTQATQQTELGLWYEIVEPLTSACGIPYRSSKGWKWDWHIIPGYSLAYTPAQRELLIDEAMRKFREVFGYYPKTVAGWVIDSHTLNYLSEHYDISAAAICRDQANTDAYTLLGGYFNQAYYPSVNNIFTPAQSKALQTNVPVFRLLGPCPIHNYDNHKYSSDAFKSLGRQSACFTLEPCWYMGSTEHTAQWLLDTFYRHESLGFSYAQIGQENSFVLVKDQVLRGTQMQIDMLLTMGDVQFRKMCDTGELFKQTYPDQTPATAVTALDHFDSTDVQSVYYNCKNYTANLFRFEDKLFFRSLFLFDERVKDLYLEETCTIFDAVYENLPIVDTRTCPRARKKQCGLEIVGPATPFEVEKVGDGVLQVRFTGGSATFFEDHITICADQLLWHADTTPASTTLTDTGFSFSYKGTRYHLDVLGAAAETQPDGSILFRAVDSLITLIPRKHL